MSKKNIIEGGDEENRVKQLNKEIMLVFERHTASFGHASAALLSVMSLYL